MSDLIADIGGTNTRCALAAAAGARRVQHFRNADFGSLTELLHAYLDRLPGAERPARAMLAIAAPVRGDTVHMTNLGWSVSAPALRDALGLDNVELLNDFEAQAWSLPLLQAAELLQVGTGAAAATAPRGVLGPGTGLGVASLVPLRDGWRAVAGEGGHVSLAASTDEEARVIAEVRRRYGHCSAERLVSGPGLTLLHDILHGEAGIDAAQLGQRIEAGERRALTSFAMFCDFLGTVAGNLALTIGAFGGIYVSGGVLPRHARRFAASGFRARFEAKGRYAGYLAAIPTWLITAADPALTGLCHRASSRG